MQEPWVQHPALSLSRHDDTRLKSQALEGGSWRIRSIRSSSATWQVETSLLPEILSQRKKNSSSSHLAVTPIQLNLQSLRQWPHCNYVYLSHPPWLRWRLSHLFYPLLWLQLIAPHHARSMHLFIQQRFHENIHIDSLDQAGWALERSRKPDAFPGSF